MSEQSSRQFRGGPGGVPATPHRVPVASFTNYADAERAVDRLSDLGFPVQRTAIVGQDLQLVEQVTGRATSLTSALRGAASGALPGVLIGWLFGLFSLVNPLVASLVLALYGLIIGVVLGGLLGAIMHALQRGRRDFHAVTLTVPARYEVLVDPEVADEARRLLSGSPAEQPRQMRSSGT